MSETHTNEIPFVEEGLIDENGHLIGSKCTSCNHHTFPSQKYCPRCTREMEETTLSKEGKLYSYTIVRTGPPWWKDKIPYTIGEVELPEGVIIRTHIKNDNLENLSIGKKYTIEDFVIVNEFNEKIRVYRFAKSE